MPETLYWDGEKDPADIDYYEAEVDATWLSTDTITGVSVTVPDGSELIVANTGIAANIVRIQFTGGIGGTHNIEITVTVNSGDRVRQKTVFLVVKEQ